jgi:hypothetical protein
LTEAHGYLVYKMKIVNEDMKKYKVLVDPGNGSILYQKGITYSDYDHKKWATRWRQIQRWVQR